MDNQPIFNSDQLKVLTEMGWDCAHHPPSQHVHFGWSFLTIDENGKVTLNYTAPVNVDPDDGKYDLRETRYIYKNFDDYIERRQPEKVTSKYLD
jgi:hypothetical protein